MTYTFFHLKCCLCETECQEAFGKYMYKVGTSFCLQFLLWQSEKWHTRLMPSVCVPCTIILVNGKCLNIFERYFIMFQHIQLHSVYYGTI